MISLPTSRSKPSHPNSHYVAIIGDIVASRLIDPTHRPRVQDEFHALLHSLNHTFATALAAPFTIASGDEFEGLLHSSHAPDAIPKIVWQVDKLCADQAPSAAAHPLIIRLGIGLGTIDTAVAHNPNSMDGPAFHAAREAIRLAAKKKILGGVFAGFGEPYNIILNGIARVLQHQRARWSPQQHRLALCLHKGIKQANAATALGLTPQAVSDYAKSAGWHAYLEGELAWSKTIELSLLNRTA